MGKTACFTGHRPNKLGGYNGERAVKIQDGIFNSLTSAIQKAVESGFDAFISGGALGVDQIAAEAVLYVKPKYPNIKLIIAKPFPSQSNRWPKNTQIEFEDLCSRADEVIDVSDDPFSPEKMQIRNEWMVDKSAAVIAVYNGGGGGTNNCVKYAQKTFKPILLINPYTLIEKWQLPSKHTW